MIKYCGNRLVVFINRWFLIYNPISIALPPTYNFIVWILGGNFEGRAILLLRNAYDYPFITFADETIISNSDVNGHFVISNDINLGPSHISGVVHDGAYIDNALVTANKERPLACWFCCHLQYKWYRCVNGFTNC